MALKDSLREKKVTLFRCWMFILSMPVRLLSREREEGVRDVEVQDVHVDQRVFSPRSIRFLSRLGYEPDQGLDSKYHRNCFCLCEMNERVPPKFYEASVSV